MSTYSTDYASRSPQYSLEDKSTFIVHRKRINLGYTQYMFATKHIVMALAFFTISSCSNTSDIDTNYYNELYMSKSVYTQLTSFNLTQFAQCLNTSNSEIRILKSLFGSYTVVPRFNLEFDSDTWLDCLREQSVSTAMFVSDGTFIESDEEEEDMENSEILEWYSKSATITSNTLKKIADPIGQIMHNIFNGIKTCFPGFTPFSLLHCRACHNLQNAPTTSGRNSPSMRFMTTSAIMQLGMASAYSVLALHIMPIVPWIYEPWS